MDFLTLFLGILIAALVIGNLLLSLLSGKRRPVQSVVQNSQFSYPAVQEPSSIIESQLETRASFSEDRVSDKLALIEARVSALNNKILMAHDRLQRVETMLMRSLSPQVSLPGSLQASSVDDTVLSSRIEKLMDFKANSEIEIAAMKEALREKGILPQVGEKNSNSTFDDEMRQKLRKAGRDLSDSERRAHDLIYHAAKK